MKVQIRKVPGDTIKNCCLISQDLFDSLKLSEEVTYELHLGQKSKVLFIRKRKDLEESIYLPETIFNELLPFENVKLNIWLDNRDIYLGPLVGIFETPRMIEEIANSKAGFCEIQYLMAAIAEGCLCYYFSPEDIDWEKENIKGVTFFPELGKWEYLCFSMPDVIYDEGIFLTERLKPMAKKVRREFRNNPNVKFINSRNGIDKWELSEKLSKYPAVKKYIPDTMACTKFNDIQIMLEKYGFIFVKSFFGSKGEEVISLEKTNGAYKINFYDYDKSELKELSMTAIEKVEEFINDFFGESRYVIQQGIRLLEFQKRKMDMRVLLQKNEKGIWECMYIESRIAKKDLNITNISAGGDGVIYDDIYPLLKSAHCTEGIPDSNKITDVSIKIASYIEREFGLFGELGMDMAIDIFGNLWVLEANAKPDKDIDTEFLDINGRPFIDSIIEKKLKVSRGSIQMRKNPEIIVPMASATFKYAKFLVKCK